MHYPVLILAALGHVNQLRCFMGKTNKSPIHSRTLKNSI